MFNFKALHLGHYAKSMGLRDSPAALGAGAAFRAKREMKERREKKEKRRYELTGFVCWCSCVLLLLYLLTFLYELLRTESILFYLFYSLCVVKGMK